MPKTKNEFLNYINTLLETTTKPEAKTVVEYEKMLVAKSKLFTSVELLMTSKLKGMSFKGICDLVIATASIDDKAVKNMAYSKVKGICNVFDSTPKKEEAKKIRDEETPFEEKINKFVELYNNLSEKEKTVAEKSLFEKVRSSFIIDFTEDKELSNHLSKIVDKFEIKEFPDPVITTVESLDASDRHPLNERVEELKKNPEVSNDPELVQALDNANKYYSVSEASTLDLAYTENTASLAAEISLEESEAMYGSKGVDLNDFHRSNGNSFKGTDEKFFEYYNIATKSMWSFPDAEKQAIKEYFDKVKIVSDKYSNHPSDLELHYKFKELCKDLDDAVNSENLNPELIKNKSAELKDFYNAVDTACKDAYNLNPGRDMVSNNSFSRVPLPASLRLQYVGGTRLRSVGQLIKLFEKTGVTLDEFLDAPMVATDKIYTEMYKHTKATASSQEKYICDYLSDETRSIMMSESVKAATYMAEIQRGVEGVLNLIANPDVRKQLVTDFNIFFHTTAAKHVDVVNAFNENIYLENVEKMLITENDDMDIRNLSDTTIGQYNPTTKGLVKKFDKEEYIRSGKTSPLSVMQRMLKVTELASGRDDIIPEELDSVIINVGRVMLPIVNENGSKFVKRAVNLIAEGRIDELTATEKTIISVAADVSHSIKNQKVEENKRDLCTKIEGLKREYASRSFIYKIFGRETRMLGKMIDSLKGEMIANGVTIEELEHPENIVAPVVNENNENSRLNIEIEKNEIEPNQEELEINNEPIKENKKEDTLAKDDVLTKDNQ